MPITKSAKLALKKDKKRAVINKPYKGRYKSALKKAYKSLLKKDIQTAYSALDKAVKKKLIHKNKAARLKSNLAKNSQKPIKKTKPVKTKIKKSQLKTTKKKKSKSK